MIDYKELTTLAETEVITIFESNLHPELIYHNLQHTISVVTAAEIMATHYQYEERSKALLLTAAWFHDIGYLKTKGENHEIISAEIAEEFLKKNDAPDDDIQYVKRCILSTKIPQNPQSEEEKIVCDADLSHFSLSDFLEYNNRLWKEREKILEKNIPQEEWMTDTLSFMSSHSYFTTYADSNYTNGKQSNINIIKEILNKNKQENPLALKKEKVEKPSKGIETMFRIASGNNQRMADMADKKAHILITVNSIIMSIVFSQLLKKLEVHSYLNIPIYILLSINLISMFFSLLATRPNLSPGKFSQKDLEEKKVNLIFFGNYYRMPFDNYYQGMKIVMGDHDYLYQTLTKDVYAQGIVLSKKYKLLRISYSVFMFGIVISALSFVIATVLLG
ncbi:phosphohydrolase [Chryseobacterium lactis]|uniref:HD domain-containing protein n=1 Tax=Chryseobacterium lactis TaxID=1241981 RepID=A0A3G6RSP6_CHRLC|nr:Pycsar system effector family protein [Chryseobacterium lactis]AZA84124.1 HD domain-containing protein [Chryseobacterium lactis]AZB04510.1 HD domain-containing protein [Chryseobacterium lactis]PNW12679.1 phosphohydrolase [Chryseobacterium lactis]